MIKIITSRSNKKIIITTLALSFYMLTGCAGLQDKSNQEIGTTVGAVIGGVAGILIGKGPVSTAAGAAAGALTGWTIGRYLDDQDLEQMNDAAQKALATGKTQSWSNPKTNVSGTASLLNTKENAAGCKTIKQTIKLNNGSLKQENVTACKGKSGWEIQEG